MKVTTSIEGWDLVRFEGDEEIRVRDLDLGERAGPDAAARITCGNSSR